MGCFDSVCSVSHLPISDHDEVVMIFAGAMFHTEYGHTGYRPIMFPMFGTYNDYGALENINEESFSWKMAQQLIKTEFKHVTLPTYREHEPWEVFMDNMIGRSNQILPDHWTYGGSKSEFVLGDPHHPDQIAYEMKKGNGSNVSQMLVHRKVYNHICKSFHNSTIGYGKNPKTFGEYMTDIPEYVREVAKRAKLAELVIMCEDKEQRNEILDKAGLSYIDVMVGGRVFLGDHYHPLDWMMGDTRDEIPFYFMAMSVYKEMFREFCKNDNLDKAEELLIAICEVYTFVQGLNMFNMDCTPYQGYAAEQHQGIIGAKEMIELFGVFTDIENTKIKEWKEWEEE